MWVDYRGSLSTVYNDGEISTCGQIKEVHSQESIVTMTSIPCTFTSTVIDTTLHTHLHNKHGFHTSMAPLLKFTISQWASCEITDHIPLRKPFRGYTSGQSTNQIRLYGSAVSYSPESLPLQ